MGEAWFSDITQDPHSGLGPVHGAAPSPPGAGPDHRPPPARVAAPAADAAARQVPGLLHPAGSAALLRQGCAPAPPSRHPQPRGRVEHNSPRLPVAPPHRHKQERPPAPRDRRPAPAGQPWPELSATGEAARPASSQERGGGKAASSAARRPLHPHKGSRRFPSQHPPPVAGGAAPLTSARRRPPRQLLHSAAAKPNNIPYSGSGAPTVPARRGGGRGLRRPFPRGAPREM